VPRPLIVRIFVGPHGLRAGWRFSLFFILVALALLAVSKGMPRIAGALPGPAVRVLGNFLALATILIAIWLLGRIETGRVWNYGFVAPHQGRNLVAGLLIGFTSLSVLMGLLTAVGAFKPGPPELHGADVLLWGSYWALCFALAAFVEEIITRSYALFSLAQGIGFWPAAIMMSVLFGAGHLGNSGEQWIGIVNAAIVGLVLAYSVKWTGSLWWAVGYHLTWDWGESFFYGVADSGFKAQHCFLSGQPAGAAWLSGGSVGPEGSALAAPVLLALIVALRFTAPRWENPWLGRLPRTVPPLPADAAQNPSGIPLA